MRLVLKTLMLFAVVGAQAAPPPFEKWEILAESVQGQSIAFDRSSLHRVGDLLTLTVLANFSPPREFDGRPLHSYVSQEAIDCRLKRYAILEAAGFSERDGRGEVVGREPLVTIESAKWTTPKPMSVGQEKIGQICQAVFGVPIT